jgi:hypothetical protein
MATRLLAIPMVMVLVLAGCAPASAPAAKPAAAPDAAAKPAAAAPAASPAGPLPAAKPAAPAAAAPAAPAAKPAAAPEAAAKSATFQDALAKVGSAADLPTLPQIAQLRRMVIYNTEITLLVKSVDDAVRILGDLAFLQGGYVAGVENSTEAGLPVSTVRIKVLPERYQDTMNQLRGLAIEVRGEKATTHDVTEEYSDTQTQLASLEATHAQLLELMRRANTMEEIIKIQQQAAQVKLQIDRLRGRATALERLSELATITAKLQSAEAHLGKDFMAVRTQLRQAESQLASLQTALKRAKTPEEENGIRDKLGELALQIDQARQRLLDIKKKSDLAGVTLPSMSQDEPELVAADDVELQKQFINTRVQLRRTEGRQSEVSRQLKQNLPAEQVAALRAELTSTILEISRLNTQLKAIQERASQRGVVLPPLPPDQEAHLAGTTVDPGQPDPIKSAAGAWEASLAFLKTVLAAMLSAVVFLWWALPLFAVFGLLLYRSGAVRALVPRVKGEGS